MVNFVQVVKPSGVRPLLALFLGGLLFAGCGQPGTSNHQTITATNTAPTPQVAGPGPGEKACFACNGTGMVKCTEPGCVDGWVPCPGPCLKLSQGIWSYTDINGNHSDILWQTLYVPDGRPVLGVSEHHLGEVFVYENGQYQDIGKCKICGGTGKVKCDVCKGTGRVVCPVCNGKKFIPVAWTPTDNPYFNSQPDVIRLADGQVVLGRIAGEVDGEKIIVTRDKKVLHVKASDILPKTNSPAAPVSPGI